MPRKVFVSGEILTAADVNANLMDQAVQVFDNATARNAAIPAPIEGMIAYLKDTDALVTYGTAWAPAVNTATLQDASVTTGKIAGSAITEGLIADDAVTLAKLGSDVPLGKILQVVRDTDATLRTTTSGTLVDAGITATITPVSASSTLFVYWYYRQAQSGDTNTTNTARFSITDSGNNGLSGATNVNHVDHITIGVSTSLPLVMVGTVASGSTSSRTYKARFMRVSGAGTISIENAQSIGQMIIMEVAG